MEGCQKAFSTLLLCEREGKSSLSGVAQAGRGSGGLAHLAVGFTECCEQEGSLVVVCLQRG